MPTQNELISNYRQLPDDQLINLAISEAHDLTPEALDVLKEECRRRRLGNQLETATDIQSNVLSLEEQQDLVESFRHLPCPTCGAESGLLNAALVATAGSFVIFTHYEKHMVVGCSACITAAANKATNHTLAFGWWGIPWGPIQAIQAILTNARANLAAERGNATETLNQYVLANRGAIFLMLQQHEDSLKTKVCGSKAISHFTFAIHRKPMGMRKIQ